METLCLTMHAILLLLTYYYLNNNVDFEKDIAQIIIFLLNKTYRALYSQFNVLYSAIAYIKTRHLNIYVTIR